MFTGYDKAWVRKMGGQLGQKGEIPAGRFNAGQKMFYWYSLFIRHAPRKQ